MLLQRPMMMMMMMLTILIDWLTKQTLIISYSGGYFKSKPNQRLPAENNYDDRDNSHNKQNQEVDADVDEDFDENDDKCATLDHRAAAVGSAMWSEVTDCMWIDALCYVVNCTCQVWWCRVNRKSRNSTRAIYIVSILTPSATLKGW